jgi:hypothetical protein
MAAGIASISELIAKKNYVKAIEVIKTQLKAGKHNPQLHIQLADVLILAKKEKEAIQILMRVADEFAHEGFEAKAIGVLKKIDRMEPGRKDVQSKLAGLVKRPTPSAPVSRGGGGGGTLEIGLEEIGFDAPASSGRSVPARSPEPEPEPIVAPPPPPPVRTAPPAPRREEPELPSFQPAAEPALDLALDGPTPALDLGLDMRPAPPPAVKAPPKIVPAPVQDLDFGEDEEEPPVPEVDPGLVLEPTDEDAAPVEIDDIQLEPDPEIVPIEEDGQPPAGDAAFDDLFTQELLGAIDEAFESGGPSAHAGEAPKVVRGDVMSSPLFKGFAPDELVAILEGLTFHTFEPGDIILAQGAPGHSLFILSTGVVKAFVKDEYGNYQFVKDFEEGSFFGEVAILTGQPRTATITAAAHCELLELDRGTLDAISISHPHVQEVLQEFYQERMKG